MFIRRVFPKALLGGAILIILAVVPSRGEAGTQRFWTELPASGSFVKADTMPDFVTLAARLSPAVVNISMGDSPDAGPDSPSDPDDPSPGPLEDFGSPRHEKSLGSGFLVAKDGYILTNDHVIDGPGKITVTTQSGENYTARIVGRDEKSDIALIKIDPKHDLPVAPLGNSDNVKVGQWVIAIGNPFGFDHSVTAGIVSAKGRFVSHNYDDFIQTDTSINPGNSGGPLIDSRGEVVGVNSAIYTHTGSSMGIGFAIPVNLVKEELPQLRTAGRVKRGWLGVSIQPVTSELAESLGLSGTRGALVNEVLKNGPAKAAGIRHGDVILSLDGQPVGDWRELPLLVGNAGIGAKSTVTIVRDKKTIDVPITISESHEEQIASAEGAHGMDAKAAAPFGLRMKDLSPALAEELGLTRRSGVVISSVAPGSRADEAGLHARDIILEVDRTPVKSAESCKSLIKSGGKGKNVLLWIERGGSKLYVALKPEA